MSRDQASKIQILSAKHKGLLWEVDAKLDSFASLEAVQEMIERKYGEKLSTTAVQTYKQKHWKVEKDRIREQKAHLKAIAEIIGEDGLAAGVNALLWQALQTMTPTQLIALKKVVNDDKKVELMKKQFALYAQEHRERMKERRAAHQAGRVTSAEVDGPEDYARAQKVVQQVKEIFGIGLGDSDPPEQPLLGPGEEPPPPEALTVLGNESARRKNSE